MSLHIKLFGQLADLVASNNISLEGVQDINSMKESVFRKFPQLEKASFLIACNQEIITGNKTLHADDEIAFLPPFAGG